LFFFGLQPLLIPAFCHDSIQNNLLLAFIPRKQAMAFIVDTAIPEVLEQKFDMVSEQELPKVKVVNIMATVTYPCESAKCLVHPRMKQIYPCESTGCHPGDFFNLKHIFQTISRGFTSKEEVKKKIGKGRVTLLFKAPFPATVSIFRTNQFTVVSVKSEEQMNVIVTRVHNLLVKAVKYSHLKDLDYSVHIKNITATYDLDTAGSKLCLDKLNKEAHKIYWRLNNSGIFSNILIEYEPELFPGLQWFRKGFVPGEHKIPFDKVVISAFSSGKMTMTGCGDIKKICFALKELLDYIQKHKDEFIPGA
jgi:TATA-box binding protein (TBP) (component of TFIID and TFIIIB)